MVNVILQRSLGSWWSRNLFEVEPSAREPPPDSLLAAALLVLKQTASVQPMECCRTLAKLVVKSQTEGRFHSLVVAERLNAAKDHKLVLVACGQRMLFSLISRRAFISQDPTSAVIQRIAKLCCGILVSLCSSGE